MNQELPDVQAGFRKGRGMNDQTANICRIIKKGRVYQKKSAAALLIIPKPLTVSITTVENFSRYESTRPPYLTPEKTVCRSRSNS